MGMDQTANTEKIIDISSNEGAMSHTNAQVKELINETVNESRANIPVKSQRGSMAL